VVTMCAARHRRSPCTMFINFLSTQRLHAIYHDFVLSATRRRYGFSQGEPAWGDFQN
jgi:hypothetical protein